MMLVEAAGKCHLVMKSTTGRQLVVRAESPLMVHPLVLTRVLRAGAASAPYWRPVAPRLRPEGVAALAAQPARASAAALVAALSTVLLACHQLMSPPLCLSAVAAKGFPLCCLALEKHPHLSVLGSWVVIVEHCIPHPNNSGFISCHSYIFGIVGIKRGHS